MFVRLNLLLIFLFSVKYLSNISFNGYVFTIFFSIILNSLSPSFLFASLLEKVFKAGYGVSRMNETAQSEKGDCAVRAFANAFGS
jgi:hypothetical protein